MEVFITGATGYIGSAVAREFTTRGHRVAGLARSQATEQKLSKRGCTAVPGDLRQPEEFLEAAQQADVVIHAANTGDEDAAAVDEAATKAMLEAIKGSGKTLVYTSGAWVLGETGDEVADEFAVKNPAALVAWRAPLEAWVREAAGRGERTVVIRPGIVYGRGGGIPALMAEGVLPVVGEGRQRWPVVHVDDLAALYAAAVERAPGGAVLHGVSGEVTARAVGATVGANFIPLETAIEELGAFAAALALDQRVSSWKTRDLVGWVPREPGFLEAPDVAPTTQQS